MAKTIPAIHINLLKLNFILKCTQEEQNDTGVGGHGVHLSLWIHQEYNLRHRGACRTPAESRQESLTGGKENI